MQLNKTTAMAPLHAGRSARGVCGLRDHVISRYKRCAKLRLSAGAIWYTGVPDLFSVITDDILDEIAQSQRRRLEPIDAIMFAERSTNTLTKYRILVPHAEFLISPNS